MKFELLGGSEKMDARRKRAGSSMMLRRVVLFKAFAWVILAYVVIGALHGGLPQLWRHYSADRDGTQGPFRILIFSPIIVTLFAAVLAVALREALSIPAAYTPPESRMWWSPRSFRGPPLCS